MSDDIIESKSGEPIDVRKERSKGDALRSLLWGLAFIALGSLLFAHSQGYFKNQVVGGEIFKGLSDKLCINGYFGCKRKVSGSKYYVSEVNRLFA